MRFVGVFCALLVDFFVFSGWFLVLYWRFWVPCDFFFGGLLGFFGALLVIFDWLLVGFLVFSWCFLMPYL